MSSNMYDTPLYEQGSEACRNYSRLTMQVRSLSQHVLIGAVIGLSVSTLKDGGDTSLDFIFLCGGIVLGCFNVALALVDWHYQSAL